MIPKLIGSIPKQNFELIRDKIGEILLIELQNQKVLQGFSELINIYSERTQPIQNNELLTININLASGDFSSKSQKESTGKLMFNIDIYTSGTSTSDIDGSVDSAFRLHRYLGMIRYILSYTGYKTLNMPLGIIGGTETENFFIMESDLKQDSSYIKMARLQFSVRATENQPLEQGIPLLENESKVLLHETELGYLFKFKNE